MFNDDAFKVKLFELLVIKLWSLSIIHSLIVACCYSEAAIDMDMDTVDPGTAVQ